MAGKRGVGGLFISPRVNKARGLKRLFIQQRVDEHGDVLTRRTKTEEDKLS